MFVLTKAQCKKWIKALRSGEFRQGRHRLKKRDNRRNTTYYSALGVLEEVCGAPRKSQYSLDTAKMVGLGYATHSDLFNLNNYDGRSFQRIAAWIEAYVLPYCPKR